jgi:DNA adenine methylase
VIRRYDTTETLFYVDPPYMPQTRSHRWGRDGYRHEIDEEGHQALLQALCRVRGMVVISGYPCAEYDHALEGWESDERQVVTFRAGMATEKVWFNPRAAARLRPQESRLFSAPAEDASGVLPAKRRAKRRA